MSFNPDEFIAGIRTAQTKVTVFQRADIAGELIAVEEDLALFPNDENGGEQDLAAGAEKAELLEKQERLQAELQGSAVEFTIQALDQERVDEIAQEARAACKDRADAAAKRAAGYAREECKRAEVTDAKEIKDAIKRATSNASNAIVTHEAGVHTLAAVIVGDTGQSVFNIEQMRQFVDKIGAPQVRKLQKAFYELSSNEPGDYLPKSSRPGRTDEA